MQLPVFSHITIKVMHANKLKLSKMYNQYVSNTYARELISFLWKCFTSVFYSLPPKKLRQFFSPYFLDVFSH